MCALGITVLVRERDSRVGVFFFVLSLAVSVWLFSYAWMYASTDPATAEQWARAGYLGAPFIPATSYMFTMELLDLTDRRGWLAALLWALGAAMALSIIGGNWVFHGMYDYGWGYYPDYDPLGGAALIGMIVLGMGAVVYEWWYAFHNSNSDARRQQAKWFLIAFAIAPITFFDFLPSFEVQTYPFGYLVVATVDAIIALAILKFDLVELTPSFAAERILETMADPVVVCDEHGEIKITNNAVEELFGFDREFLEGTKLNSLFDEHLKARELLIDDPTSPLRDEEMIFEGAQDEKVAVSISRNPVDGPGGERIGAVLIGRDISERKSTEAALKRSQRRYELAADGAHDGLWDWDVDKNSVFYSQRWKQMLGLDDADVSDSPDEWLERIHPDDRERFETVVAARREEQSSHFEVDYRIEHGDGEFRWMLCRGAIVRNDDGEVIRMAGSQTDITERKRVEAQLRHDAFHDALTEIPNRALFIDRVEQLLEGREQESNRPFSVLFMDLDRFKAINDSLGHTTGDELLKRVTYRIQDCLRRADTLARVGGDEFGILLAGLGNEKKARSVANRIRSKLEDPFLIDDHKLYVSASIGVLVSEGQYDSPKDLLRDADLAMYNAKRDQLKQIAVFETGMETGVAGEAHLESALRRAIENSELELNYHPIVKLDSEKPVGFEALARWNHEEFGAIPPDEFIPLAQETGMVVELGRSMIRAASKQMKAWLDEGLIGPEHAMNVNLSAPEIASPELPQVLEKILDDTGLDGHNLQVEITERILITNPDDIAKMFDELDEMDVRICIDDFGTGYSSLSYLRRFRADSLKIDREFIQGLHRSKEDQEIVRAVMRLADKLGLEVVAEGIESTRQLDVLRELDVAYGQGFLWAKPRTAHQIEQMLRGGDEAPVPTPAH